MRAAAAALQIGRKKARQMNGKISSAVNGVPTVVWYFLTNFELLSIESTRFITAECVRLLILFEACAAFDADAVEIVPSGAQKKCYTKMYFRLYFVVAAAVATLDAVDAGCYALIIIMIALARSAAKVKCMQMNIVCASNMNKKHFQWIIIFLFSLAIRRSFDFFPLCRRRKVKKTNPPRLNLKFYTVLHRKNSFIFYNRGFVPHSCRNNRKKTIYRHIHCGLRHRCIERTYYTGTKFRIFGNILVFNYVRNVAAAAAAAVHAHVLYCYSSPVRSTSSAPY